MSLVYGRKGPVLRGIKATKIPLSKEIFNGFLDITGHSVDSNVKEAVRNGCLFCYA